MHIHIGGQLHVVLSLAWLKDENSNDTNHFNEELQ